MQCVAPSFCVLRQGALNAVVTVLPAVIPFLSFEMLLPAMTIGFRYLAWFDERVAEHQSGEKSSILFASP